MTASPPWRPGPPIKARGQRPLSILAGFCLDPKQASPNPRLKFRAPGSRGASTLGPLLALAVLKSGGSAPRFYPPGPTPTQHRSPWASQAVDPSVPGSRGSSPWKSGRKSHSQKVPKLQCSEVRSQAAAAAETSPSSPRRNEPWGWQPRVAAAIRVRPELGLGLPTASPKNYSFRRASLRGSHFPRPTTPGPPLVPLKGPPLHPSAGPEGGLQGEPANCSTRDGGPRFHGHGN